MYSGIPNKSILQNFLVKLHILCENAQEYCVLFVLHKLNYYIEGQNDFSGYKVIVAWRAKMILLD